MSSGTRTAMSSKAEVQKVKRSQLRQSIEPLLNPSSSAASMLAKLKAALRRY